MGRVSFKDVRKKYGKVDVLHGIDFDIEDGEFAILVGPSGCGKSTLLRMLAGLEDITHGTISIKDKVINDAAPKERDIAMVFQSYALYPHMTVAQNMGFSLRLAKASKADIAERVGKAADIIGLTDYLDRYPKQLSGGQRQRVAMGRAIVRDPTVFLFDEPLSNLDAKLRVQMRAEIKSLQQRLGTTTVYVTHDQVEAMTMADRIVVMNAGIIEQQGPPLELYDNPENIFVAGFIGSPSMNFLPATVVDGGLELPAGHVLNIDTSLPLHSNVTFGIRPEHLVLDDQGLTATITVIEPLGSETLLVVDFSGHKMTLVIKGRITERPGDPITLRPVENTHFLFDPDSGKRL